MELHLFSGFLIGLAGSMHCAGMCGPIALALPSSEHTTRSHYLFGRLAYQFGRIMTYAVLGAIVGLGTGAVALAGYERIISIVAGSMMVIAATMQLLWHRSIVPNGPILRLTAPVRSTLGQLLKRRSIGAMFGLGAVNGLLPCGLVLAAIFGSAATTSPVDGAIFMSFFGLGTLPVMSVLSMGGGWLTSKLKGRYRLAMPLIALMLGSVIVLRGMGLGIPLISPKPPVEEHHAECCSHN